MSTNQELGKKSEQLACQFLEKNGLKLLEKNFNSRFGELDLIMQDSQELVFVEVRYRKNTNFGHTSETITYAKQSKIIKTASVFLQQHAKLAEYPARFDVVCLTGNVNDANIEWIKSAFET